MIETLTLDTYKDYSSSGKAHISPLRRGERNNVLLTVIVRCNSRPYDLTGMTAHLVWKAADGKIVGPVPMEVKDTAEGIVRCTLPDACYSAVGMARAYVELRRGAELVDTTDEMAIKVLDCIDAEGEQAEEYKTLIAEVGEATNAAVKAAERAESGEDKRVATETERVTAENARKQAEAERVSAEDKRAQDTETRLEELAQAAGTIDAKIAVETNRATAAESALQDSVSGLERKTVYSLFITTITDGSIGNSIMLRRVGNSVHVNIDNVKFLLDAGWTQLGTVPVEFRPSYRSCFSFTVISGGIVMGYIGNNGEFWVCTARAISEKASIYSGFVYLI